MTNSPRLIPELDVSDLDTALDFYTRVCGFDIRYQRVEEQFAMLDFAGAALMLQSATGNGRRLRTAPLERPFGRGINLQIEVDDVDALHHRVAASDEIIVVPLEERWYGTDDGEVGNRQFVGADPDGYLLRFFEDLGSRV
ncbi:MAG: VOC family protein [Thermoleophilia bacterium]|nr:VOC family protein [Thermoleophilia bacterium]